MPSSNIVIVGGGMASLLAALKLLREGHGVTLLEQTDRLGGYFTGFENEAGDRFDLAVSHLLSGTAGEPLERLVEQEQLDGVVFDHAEIADVMTLKGKSYVLPTGLEALRLSLVDAFPNSADEIGRVITFMQTFLGAEDSANAKFMMQNYKRYFQEFCEAELSDPTLRNIFGMRIQCDDSSLMIMAGFITEVYGKGMVYPRGGVFALVQALGARIRELGGEIRLGTKALGLEFEGAVATGVTLDGGETLSADAVLYNGDVLALQRILTDADLPQLKIGSRKVGHSSLSIFVTLENSDLSRFGSAARHYLSDTDDVFETYRQLETGALPSEPVIKVHFMSQLDASLAAEGRELVRIEVDMYHYETGYDQGFYERYAEEVLRRVEQSILPELATDVAYLRVITPIDYENWFGHAGGSATGWAHDVNNYMVNRMNQRTPIRNLYITGQWGEYGSGLPQLMRSADKSVQLTNAWMRKKVTA